MLTETNSYKQTEISAGKFYHQNAKKKIPFP